MTDKPKSLAASFADTIVGLFSSHAASAPAEASDAHERPTSDTVLELACRALELERLAVRAGQHSWLHSNKRDDDPHISRRAAKVAAEARESAICSILFESASDTASRETRTTCRFMLDDGDELFALSIRSDDNDFDDESRLCIRAKIASTDILEAHALRLASEAGADRFIDAAEDGLQALIAATDEAEERAKLDARRDAEFASTALTEQASAKIAARARKP